MVMSGLFVKGDNWSAGDLAKLFDQRLQHFGSSLSSFVLSQHFGELVEHFLAAGVAAFGLGEAADEFHVDFVDADLEGSFVEVGVGEGD